MSYEQQKKEIETIRERNIKVKLSDADCERLMRKCGAFEITVGELIASFVGDMVVGTYSNGSDERDLIDGWFGRCGFGTGSDPTLLSHLLYYGYDPEEYLKIQDIIDSYRHELAEETDREERRYLTEEILRLEEDLIDMRTDWKIKKAPDMEEEIKHMKEWVKEKENLMVNR